MKTEGMRSAAIMELICVKNLKYTESWKKKHMPYVTHFKSDGLHLTTLNSFFKEKQIGKFLSHIPSDRKLSVFEWK